MATIEAMARALDQAQNRLSEAILRLIGDDPDLQAKVDAMNAIMPHPAQPMIAQAEQLNILADVVEHLADRDKKRSRKEPPPPPEEGDGDGDENASESGKGSSAETDAPARDETPKLAAPSGHASDSSRSSAPKGDAKSKTSKSGK